MPEERTVAGDEADLALEIAHLLLIDVVGYSKLLVNEQIELMQKLNRIVRGTESCQRVEASGKLIRLPTGDGMALLFFRSPEEPVQCALEIAKALQSHRDILLRMGIHSGPVNQVPDVNDRSNFAGTGLNVAQRVMDCGDAGHILLSKHVADDLAQYRHWNPYLHDLGECEVKHGLRLHLVNLYKDELGNPAVPEKLRRGKRWKQLSQVAVKSVDAPRWRKLLLIAAVFLSVLALAISFSIFFRRGAMMGASSLAALVSEKSIAVLPFENLSAEPTNAFFTDGVQDEILLNLARIAELKVISRTSVMQYKTGAERNVREIGQQLGVAHVLEGSVQREGNRIRVSAQLIDARTDTQLWAQRYDRELADVFAIQSEIAQEIADQLRAKLSPSEKAAIAERPTSDLVAYDRYVRAKVLLDITTFSSRARENLLQAVQLLDDAVARDPAFLLAYCELAAANDRLYFLGIDHTPERLALGEAAVQRLVRIRPDAGETHLAQAQHLYRGYLDYDQAHRELAIALRKLPNNPLVHELAGYIERRQGRWSESTQELERALELDPRNCFILQQLSLTYQNLRRFSDTEVVLDRALEITPADIETRTARAQVELEWHGDTHPLHALIEEILTDNPGAAEAIAERWLLSALCERDSGALTRVVAAVPPYGVNENGVTFPLGWCRGLVARLRGDATGARTAFLEARTEVEKVVRSQPDYAKGLAVMGMIDAALGRKEDALREGKRAVELLPVTKDALNGAYMLRYLAITYAWTGEKDLAINELIAASQVPGDVTYGQLRLHPNWDPLRGDPRFDALVAKLAPAREKR